MIKTIKHWFVKDPVKFMLGYYAVYIMLFLLVEQIVSVPRYIIHSPIDDMIPFSKYAILPYASWFVFIPGSLVFLLLKGSREELWKLSAPMIVGMLTTLALYLVFPNGVDLRPASVDGNDIFAMAVRLIIE